MARQISRGQCSFCQQIIAKNAIVKHLSTCEKRAARLNKPPNGKAKIRHIPLIQLLMEGNGLPQYWMHIEVPADASLKNLDGFLRDIWLECCGHMSAFTVGAQRYSVMPEAGYGERGMAAKVGMIFTPGTAALHEYDFGTTTELTLKYVGEREANYRGYDIGILARNEPPVYKCEVCGEIATKVCSACIWENAGWLCDEHASAHECGEDMLLPVVNSPRVGMCAYAGPLR
jgi:hypothetical protein